MAIQNKIKISKPYFENLDALRFLAAFAVFIFHFFSETTALFSFDTENSTYKVVNVIISKGTLGVNFFFVLSGFLITYLILWERYHTGTFNFKNFLIRRTLRIWPLYYLIIVIGFVLFPLIISGYSTNHSPLYYLFFLANFDEINVGLTDPINFLTAPWSVAVEEQFYLFWGLALFALHHLKVFKIKMVLCLLLLISIGFSYIHLADHRILYYHTFSVMSNIVIGSMLAVFYFQKKSWLMALENLKTWKIVSIYIIGLLVVIGKNKIFTGSLIVLEQSIISLFFAFIIFEQIHLKNGPLKLGKIKIFNHLGKISYGLYLYHLLVMYLVLHFSDSFLKERAPEIGSFVFFIICILITYLVSYLSYHYFEKPFLSLKKKFS